MVVFALRKAIPPFRSEPRTERAPARSKLSVAQREAETAAERSKREDVARVGGGLKFVFRFAGECKKYHHPRAHWLCKSVQVLLQHAPLLPITFCFDRKG